MSARDVEARLRALAADENSWLHQWPLLEEAADEIDRLCTETRELHAQIVKLRKLADLNALRRTLTNPTLRRITRTVPK